MFSLDIETSDTTGKSRDDQVHALEPYRVLTNEAEITAVSVWGPEGLVQCIHYKEDNFKYNLTKLLISLQGEEVYCTNTIFDVSFLLATVGTDLLRPIKWRDTVILNKWLVNGQKADEKRLSFSLAKSVERYLKDWDKLDEFLDIKGQSVTPGENFEYWLERNILDAEATWLLAEFLLGHLKNMPNSNGYVVTCNAILPIAEGYVHGIDVDKEALEEYDEGIGARQKEILEELRIEGSVITSTKQLAILLFDNWNLTPIGLTPKGAPSTSAENMLRLYQKYRNDRPELELIMEYKKLATMKSKYVKGFNQSMDYLGTNKIHGQPRLLSTITGRMTYTTKFFKKAKFQTSIAMQQLPRKEKAIKQCLVAPKGYKIFYFDFAAQEGRVMADVAEEGSMINAYNMGIDLHSTLTEEIFGTPYDVIVKANEDGDPKEIIEQRQAGKLTNLSSFYRIGAKSLADKFFSTYNHDISIQTAQSYLTSFKRSFPGVVKYWKTSIAQAKRDGFASAYGGWRYRLKSFDWKGESSAINHPIQGGGSMLTYASIALVNKKWPDLILLGQVHDSLTYIIPEDMSEEALDIVHYLNQFDYGSLLGFNQKVPFIVDGAIGDNFADLQSIK